MILRRLGNKSSIAKDIIKHFPQHKIYVEPFFGSGGMFFNKPKAKHNILNDLDNDVFNLFEIMKYTPELLLDKLEKTPYSDAVFNDWKTNLETDNLWKAVRFIYLSNFGFLGKPNNLKIDSRTHKKQALINYEKTILFLKDCSCVFTNSDFRRAIKQISLSENNTQEKTFIYCDPPYLGTDDNYSHSFKESDSLDLFDTLQATGCKFAMSEFDNDYILSQAKKRCLNVVYIGERRNLKKSRTEILITNYEKQKSLFD